MGSVGKERKKLLYVLDDVNYPSGARNATALQIAALADSFDISLFSLEVPDEHSRTLFPAVQWLEVEGMEACRCLNRPLRQVLAGPSFHLSQRLLKLRQAFAILAGRQKSFTTKLFWPLLCGPFEAFDAVVVVSEASKFRGVVSLLQHPRKIQWIHTDYVRWRQASRWAKGVSANDGQLYGRFDSIVTLSERCREEFSALYPQLSGKTMTIRNLVDVQGIQKRAQEPCSLPWPPDGMRILSIGRAEWEKNFDWAIDSAKRLSEEGLPFCWIVVGGGSLLAQLQRRAEEEGLCGFLRFVGPVENPLPLLKAADLFVLMSSYEGTPVTIDEALVLGVPILATDVGGVAEQVGGYKNAILVLPEEERFYVTFRLLLNEEGHLRAMREAVKDCTVQNADSEKKTRLLFEP